MPRELAFFSCLAARLAGSAIVQPPFAVLYGDHDDTVVAEWRRRD
jgi:hypothetical protein